MKYLSAIVGLVLSIACAGADEYDESLSVGQAKQGVSVSRGEGTNTFGSNGIAPYTKCRSDGAANQDCLFVRPAVLGDIGFAGHPTRYKVQLVGSNGPLLSTQNSRTVLTQVVDKITFDLGSPPQTSPVIVEMDTTTFAATPVGINFYSATIPGNIGTQRTDNYMRIEFNACLSNGLTEPVALNGVYRPCGVVGVFVDRAKLYADHKPSTLGEFAAIKFERQLYAKAVLTALGLGRQEVTSGYPTRRDFGTMLFDTGSTPGSILTITERNQLQCAGFTFNGFGIDQFGMLTQLTCGRARS